MITLTAKINLLSGDNSALTLASTDLSGNNISSNLSGIVGVKKNGRNPFIIGASKLGDGSTFSDGVDYFIGDQSTDDNGNFTTPYEIEIKSVFRFSNLTISFDKANGRHPKSIYVDGVKYIDDDPIFTVTGLTEKTSHTITIYDWNKPLYPLVITGIYTEVSIDIDRRNIISISRSIFDRSDLKLPSWGIISNTGNIEFNDTDGEIRDYAEQLLLQSGLKCEIKLNNSLIDGASETIGLFETDEWDYDNDNRVVSVSLKDDLEEWQDILLEEYPLQNEMTMYEIYEYLVSKTPSKWELVIDKKTENRLKDITCPYPYLESDNLWAQWQKFCDVCALYIYKNNEGKVVVQHKI